MASSSDLGCDFVRLKCELQLLNWAGRSSTRSVDGFVGSNCPTGHLRSWAVAVETPFSPELREQLGRKTPRGRSVNCKCQLLARRPAHLSNSPTKDYVEHVRSYENESDVAPAGARQLVSSVRPTPNDAQLPTKPAGPKSELPTANRPVATSLFAVQFQQNHSLSVVSVNRADTSGSQCFFPDLISVVLHTGTAHNPVGGLRYGISVL